MKTKLLTLGALILVCTSAIAKDWDSIRVGVDVPYPPFEMRMPDGSLSGFEIELGNAVCQQITNKDCDWVIQAWDGIIPGLLSRKYDMIFSSMSINEERKKRVLFSDAYYNIPSAFFTHVDSEFNPLATKDTRIGVQRATIQDTYLTEHHRDAEIVRYTAASDALADLTGKRIDAVFIGAPVGLEMIVGKDDYKLNGDLVNKPAAIFGAGVGAAFRNRDKDLQEKVNEALSELKSNGTYTTLMNKYFEIDISI
jgi:arginine/ornithine transport system substrate-binding protein